uniref:Secreted protein n=1 Tax=Achlya hypogyna TaxID=1202772 RepID=A0A0A7CN10_ACHHY|nr:secreted protein [Achlya hypogyna]
MWVLVVCGLSAAFADFVALNASSTDYHFGARVATDSSPSAFCGVGLLWTSAALFVPTATAMAPQFGFYNVPPTVTVVLRAIDNATTDLTPLLAPSTNRSVLLGPRLYTNYFVVEVSSSAPVCNEAGFGLSITGVVVTTFADLLVETKDRSKSEDFCGTDSSQHIVCKYSKANPQHSMYAYGRPRDSSSTLLHLILRAVLAGYGAVTATSSRTTIASVNQALLHSSHTSTGSQSDADNTQFQFVAESYLCDGILGAVCPGVTEAMSATLVRTNARLDYALLKLNAALPAKYGYLQASTASISVGTAIYIPQHPRAGCKLISNLDDSKAPTTVTSINAPGCSGKGGITYNADTDGGSSGSPVISVATNAVLALHYCGGASCMNTGMQMSRIIADLAPLGLMPANAIASGLPPVIPPFADPTINPLSLGPPFVKQAVIDGVIAQVGSVDKWQTTVDHINFHLAAPGQVIVDVLSYEMSDGTTLFQDVNGDCRIAYFDPVVYVFSNDSKVTYTTYVNDDSNSVNPEDGKADGSISYHDSYLVASLPAGSHTVAIGVTNLGYKDAVTGSNTFSYTQFLGCTGTNTTGGVDGAYRLTLSATVPLTITHAKPTPKMATCTTGDQAVVVDKCVTQFNALYGASASESGSGY